VVKTYFGQGDYTSNNAWQVGRGLNGGLTPLRQIDWELTIGDGEMGLGDGPALPTGPSSLKSFLMRGLGVLAEELGDGQIDDFRVGQRSSKDYWKISYVPTDPTPRTFTVHIVQPWHQWGFALTAAQVGQFLHWLETGTWNRSAPTGDVVCCIGGGFWVPEDGSMPKWKLELFASELSMRLTPESGRNHEFTWAKGDAEGVAGFILGAGDDEAVDASEGSESKYVTSRDGCNWTISYVPTGKPPASFKINMTWSAISEGPAGGTTQVLERNEALVLAKWLEQMPPGY
jgi:hypothetical protein